MLGEDRERLMASEHVHDRAVRCRWGLDSPLHRQQLVLLAEVDQPLRLVDRRTDTSRQCSGAEMRFAERTAEPTINDLSLRRKHYPLTVGRLPNGAWEAPRMPDL